MDTTNTGKGRDLRNIEIQFEFRIRIGRSHSKVMGRFKNFWISHACPLLVIVKRLKPLTALSGTLYRLASSVIDHTPVLFNVFEDDWNEESVVPRHISFVSFVINYWLLNARFNLYSVGPSWNVLRGIYGQFDSRFDLNADGRFITDA